MRKYLYSLLLLGATLTWQSCLHEDADTFGQPAAQRIENAMKQTQETLEAAPNGWLLRYYAGQNYSGPAYNILVKFDNGRATVVSDYDQDKTTTAAYSVTNDQGVVLSFDSYNEALHFFSRVWEGSGARGIEGDYEFMVMSTAADTIRLRGKKWKNNMELVRLPDDLNWRQYLQRIYTLKEQITSQYFLLKLGNDTIDQQAVINPEASRLAFTHNNERFETPFTFSPTGIDLLQPIQLGGQQFQHLTWNSTDKQFSQDSLTATLAIPTTYLSREEWIGDWRINSDALSLGRAVNTRRFQTVLHLTPGAAATPNYLNATLTFNGQTYGPIQVEYVPATGTVEWPAGQILVDPTGTYPGGILLVPGITRTGSLIQEGGIGLTLTWNPDQQRVSVKGYETPEGEIDAFMGVGINDQRQAMVDAQGRPVLPIYIANIRDLIKVQPRQ